MANSVLFICQRLDALQKNFKERIGELCWPSSGSKGWKPSGLGRRFMTGVLPYTISVVIRASSYIMCQASLGISDLTIIKNSPPQLFSDPQKITTFWPYVPKTFVIWALKYLMEDCLRIDALPAHDSPPFTLSRKRWSGAQSEPASKLAGLAETGNVIISNNGWFDNIKWYTLPYFNQW